MYPKWWSFYIKCHPITRSFSVPQHLQLNHPHKNTPVDNLSEQIRVSVHKAHDPMATYSPLIMMLGVNRPECTVHSTLKREGKLFSTYCNELATFSALWRQKDKVQLVQINKFLNITMGMTTFVCTHTDTIEKIVNIHNSSPMQRIQNNNGD